MGTILTNYPPVPFLTDKIMTREEAIEVYNGLINQKIKEAFEFFAPELRESEDEMIRKRLINLIKELATSKVPILTGGYFVDGQDKKYIAWLEKQKKQKPVQTEGEREYVRTLNSLIADFLRGKEDVDRTYYQQIYDWLDGRHIEQNPASTEDMPYITDEHFYEREPADSFKYKLAEYMTKCCTKKEGPYGYEYGLSAETILKMAEEELLKRGVVQKPVEWSEEDKENLLCVCGLLKHYLSAGYKGSKYWDDAQVNEWIEWTKNLPNRFQLQHKQEWSEEDENMRLEAIRVLVSGCERYRRESGCLPSWHIVINWLKSLRPQPHWKPSNEQMCSLKDTIVNTKGYQYSVYLPELYEQLKKLM